MIHLGREREREFIVLPLFAKSSSYFWGLLMIVSSCLFTINDLLSCKKASSHIYTLPIWCGKKRFCSYFKYKIFFFFFLFVFFVKPPTVCILSVIVSQNNGKCQSILLFTIDLYIIFFCVCVSPTLDYHPVHIKAFEKFNSTFKLINERETEKRTKNNGSKR